MKIGLVLDDSLDAPDGVQQYVLTLGAWLTKTGHEVHYLVGQTSRTDIVNVHSLSRNVAVRFNQNRMRIPLPASKKRLRRLLEELQLDVLHIQMPYSPWLAHRLIKMAASQTAIVGTFHIVPHGTVVRLANRGLAIWLRRSLQKFQAVMSVSEPAAAFAQKAYGLSSKVVANVVDVARYKVATPAKDASLQIVYLGRLVPRKGCQTLLEAITLLQQQKLRPAVVIAGRGPLEGRLRQYVADNGLTNVSFSGFVAEADKPALLASADISVFPSTGGESFGIVLVEAMASGKSVVLAGDNEGYHEVMKQQPQLLFQPNNSQQLADKIAYYMSHPAERQRAASSLATIAAQFAVTALGPKIVATYESALQD